MGTDQDAGYLAAYGGEPLAAHPGRHSESGPTENDAHRYARHTRNATVTIAVIIATLVVLSIVASIVGIVALTNIYNALANAG